MQSKSTAKGNMLSGCGSVIGIAAARIVIGATLKIQQMLSKPEVRARRKNVESLNRGNAGAENSSAVNSSTLRLFNGDASLPPRPSRRSYLVFVFRAFFCRLG